MFMGETCGWNGYRTSTLKNTKHSNLKSERFNETMQKWNRKENSKVKKWYSQMPKLDYLHVCFYYDYQGTDREKQHVFLWSILYRKVYFSSLYFSSLYLNSTFNYFDILFTWIMTSMPTKLCLQHLCFTGTKVKAPDYSSHGHDLFNTCNQIKFVKI